MPRPAPKYVTDASIEGAPISYKWNNDLSMKLGVGRDQNVRLYHAVDERELQGENVAGHRHRGMERLAFQR